MRSKIALVLVCVGVASFTGSAVADVNIALNKPVTLNGLYGDIGNPGLNPGGWPDSTFFPLAAAGTLDDGVYRPETTEWQDGSVWWNSRVDASANNSIIIDLQGAYTLSGFSVQADDNDTYRIEYLDTASIWQTGWDVPAVASFGLVTRDISLGSPVVGTALRFTATSGDQYYGVSEIQAFGAPVPAPASYGLLVAGLAVLGLTLKRTRSTL
jgi:hypothetical protein